MAATMTPSERIVMWSSLMKHPAWKELEAMCDEHVSLLAQNVLNPALCVEDSLRQNVERGEVKGVGYVLSIPQAEVENAQMDLRRAKGDDDESVDEQPNVP
jgi:hypothetical protein